MVIAEVFLSPVAVILGLVVAVIVVTILVRVARRSGTALAWVLGVGGTGLLGFMAVFLFELQESRSYQEQAKNRAMLNVVESLVRQSQSQQKDLEERTRNFLRKREETVGDVFPLNERKSAEVVGRPGLAWMPEVDEQFEADVFPSKQYAVRNLVRQIIPHFDDALPEGTEPKVVQLTSGTPVDTADLRRMFDTATQHLQEEFVEAQILFDPSDHRAIVPQAPRIEGGVALHLTLSSDEAPLNENSRETPAHANLFAAQRMTTLRASLEAGTGKTFAASVMILEKPWVDQYDQFWSRRKGRYIVARSDTFAETAEAAHQQAMSRAVDLLTPAMFTALNQLERRRGFVLSSESDVRDVLRSHLESGVLDTDRFSQRLQAPYGVLWREAILFRVDSAALSVLIDQIAGRSLTEHRSHLSQGFAFCVLLAVIIVLYLLLNWVTKGYYRATVGLVAGLLGAAGSTWILLAISHSA